MTAASEQGGKGVAELLPCPFCGSKDITVEESGADLRGGPDHYIFSCGCNSDNCYGYQSFQMFSRRSDAIKAWNTRAPSPKAAPQMMQPPVGWVLIPEPQEGSLHEAAVDAIQDFYENERRQTVHRLGTDGLSLKAFGAFLRAFVKNSQKYLPNNAHQRDAIASISTQSSTVPLTPAADTGEMLLREALQRIVKHRWVLGNDKIDPSYLNNLCDIAERALSKQPAPPVPDGDDEKLVLRGFDERCSDGERELAHAAFNRILSRQEPPRQTPDLEELAEDVADRLVGPAEKPSFVEAKSIVLQALQQATGENHE